MKEEFPKQENNNSEMFDQQIHWVAGDYTNETMHVEDLLQRSKIENLKKRGLKNLEERYLRKLNETSDGKKLFKDKYNNSIEEYFIQITESMDGQEMLPIFWKKKEQLDKLVNEFNEELKKEKPDIVSLKKVFNKISMVIYSNQESSYKHTPFPEVEKK